MAKRETLAKRYEDLAYKLKRKAKGINKRGYTIVLPEQPEKVTQSAFKKLEKIYANIYEFARYYDPLQDKFIKGTERRLQERQIAARKGWETRRLKAAINEYQQNAQKDREFSEWLKESAFQEMPAEEERIFDIVYDWIEFWSPSPLWSSELAELKREDRNQLKSIVDGAVAQLGKHQVCVNLKNKTVQYMDLAQEILYMSGSKYHDDGREGIRDKLDKVTAIVWGRPLTVEESIAVTSLSEEFNSFE